MKILKLFRGLFKKNKPQQEPIKEKFSLIPLHSDPIFGNSFIDPKDPVFDHPYALSLPYLMAKDDEENNQHLFI